MEGNPARGPYAGRPVRGRQDRAPVGAVNYAVLGGAALALALTVDDQC